ncbi:MAG: bpiD [Sphingomonas bacterium]|nr:bpiD [Sphingomonas bacterium]
MATLLNRAANDPQRRDAQELVRGLVSRELVFGVVGPVGSGTSEVAEALERFLEEAGYEAKILKARDVITNWAAVQNMPLLSSSKMGHTEALQDAGDQLRLSQGNAAIAVGLIDQVRLKRAASIGLEVKNGEAVRPDDNKRAYIFDSLRNPAEALLLRRVYQQAFCLIGVICSEDVRKGRLSLKYEDAGLSRIDLFMKRDEKAEQKYGQQVSSTFHLSDFFVDNSVPRFNKNPAGEDRPNPAWTVVDELGRLVDVLTHTKIIRPRPNETAMYHAFGARMRSACLSRQVGAALLDQKGNLLATGTNEVPRAGGGVYGGAFEDFSDEDPHPESDHRCAVHGGYCRNTREQNEIIEELIESVEELKLKATPELIKKLRSTRLGQLIEFSRAVHAEMEALLSAAREGVSTVGSRLFVTTYPCHNCARHIVAAGVDEVQFIEPYLKSKALPLHGESITSERLGWIPPSAFSQLPLIERRGKNPQVLFRPFTGVAPRLYRRAFYKDRDLKDDNTGEMLESFLDPDGTGVANVLQLSYSQVEAVLVAPDLEKGR